MAWAPDQVVDHAVRSADPAEAPLPRGSLAEYAAATPLEALRRLDSTRYGLTEREAQARLSRLGENEMAAGPVPGRAAAVLAAARSPFAVVLIFLAAVSAATGDIGGAALISVMAVISCALRVRQENRSDRAAAALRAVVATLCLGPVNTLADLATFVILWRITGPHASPAGQALFRAGWPAENLITQAAAVHLLRSRSRPSFRRPAARPVLLATLAVALAGIIVPFTPLGPVLRLHAPPALYFPLLAAVVVSYCAVTLAVKARYMTRTSSWL